MAAAAATKRKRSGPPGTPTMSNDERGRQMLTITLSQKALAALDEMAPTRGRSGLIDAMILREYARFLKK